MQIMFKLSFNIMYNKDLLLCMAFENYTYIYCLSKAR